MKRTNQLYVMCFKNCICMSCLFVLLVGWFANVLLWAIALELCGNVVSLCIVCVFFGCIVGECVCVGRDEKIIYVLDLRCMRLF